MPKYCCVFGCNSDSEIYPDLSFHEFPSDKKLSKAWEIRIRRVGFVPKKSSFVCGKHFERTDYSQPRSDTPAQFRRLRLKRTAIPSLNLRGNEVDEREPKRQSRAAQKARGEHEATVVTGDMAGEGETSIDLAEYSSMSSSVDVTMQSSTKESACNLDQNLAGVKGDLKEAMAEIKELQGKVFCYENLNNKDIQNYTTLTKVAFEELSQLLAHFKPLNYWYGFEVKSLSHSDQLLVCLMKLKLDVPLFDLAKRFGVSRTTITNIFYTYIHLLHEIIFVKLMKNVPSLAKNQSSMPESFGDFSNCRIILDCTEFPLSAPRKDLEAANLVYSNYKHNLTAKYLIGVAPNGAITFVSEGYPGSTSDKVVTQECNILSHLKAGDLILADKGFLLHDILPQGVSLNLPAFLSGKERFSKAEAILSRKISRSRIHVERAIERLRNFKILQALETNQRQLANKIVQVCAALVNLQSPVISGIFK